MHRRSSPSRDVDYTINSIEIANAGPDPVIPHRNPLPMLNPGLAGTSPGTPIPSMPANAGIHVFRSGAAKA
jgi:hypothetical protein